MPVQSVIKREILNCMKRISFVLSLAVAVICFFSFFGCSERADSINQFEIATPTPTGAKVYEERTPPIGSVESVPPPKSDPFSLAKEEIEKGEDSIIKDVKAEIRGLSKAIGLHDLQQRNLRGNEKEFRLWIIDSPKTSAGFVAFQKDGENFAFKVINNRATKKIEKISIAGQELDWNNWWLYIDSQRRSMREKQDLPELDIDVEFYAIEVLSDKEYILAMYSPSDLKNGDRTLADLCRKLKTQFGIESC